MGPAVQTIEQLTVEDGVHRTDPTGLADFVARDAIANAVVHGRLAGAGDGDLGGTVLAARDVNGAIVGAVFSGGSLLPLGGAEPAMRALGTHLASGHRTCSSIVGRADVVHTLHRAVGPSWGVARLVRPAQPLLVATSVPQTDRHANPAAMLRRVTSAELDAYVPAAVAMFREELDLGPLGAAAARQYRRRVAHTVRAGRAFAITDPAGTVVFKADIGAVSPATCQIQGVWTRPDLRRRGLAAAAMPQLIRFGLEFAPSVSLYVNDFNAAARGLYRGAGMREVATFATVLF